MTDPCGPKPRRGPSVWSWLKPMTDGALIALGFVAAYWLRYQVQWLRQVEAAFRVPFRVYLPSVGALVAILLLILWLEGVYRSDRERMLLDELFLVARAVVTGIAIMIVAVFVSTPSYYSRLIFAYAGGSVLLLLGASRAIERGAKARLRRRGRGVDRLLIVGAGEVARSIMRTVYARPELGYQVVGFVDDDADRGATDIGPFRALGPVARLPEIIARENVDEVIVTLPWMTQRKILRIVQQCQRDRVRVQIVPDLFQMSLSRVQVNNLNGIPLLSFREPRLSDWQYLFKRSLDLLVSVSGLLLLSPLLALVALAIKLDSPGPVFFAQTRLGRGGQPFTIFKFRTMQVDAEHAQQRLAAHNQATGPLFKMRDDPRRTRVGRLLRRTSLDELPQLWNVLKGEMSLIGPRPPIPSEVRRYASWHLRRLDVSPGLTGLWQVSGRSDLSFDEMVLLDVYYIENWSPILDLRILLRTIPTVLLGSGAY